MSPQKINKFNQPNNINNFNNIQILLKIRTNRNFQDWAEKIKKSRKNNL